MTLADLLSWVPWKVVALGVGVGLIVLAVLEERRRVPEDPGVKAFRERKSREWGDL